MQPRQRGSVHFDTQPHGADIIVDGQILINPDTEEAIKTPATVLLMEGRRDFVLRLQNHHDAVGYVDVFAGSRVDIFRNLEPIPGSNIRSVSTQRPYPYYPGYGDLFIDSEPRGGYVYIDNIPQMDTEGRAILTPVRVMGMMEGMHEVQISLDGYYSKKLIVNVISDRLNIAYAKLQPI